MPKQKPGEPAGGTAVLPQTQQKVKHPPLWKVLLHNDDYTTRDFVVFVLQTVFHLAEPEAVRIMLHVHRNGVGVAGVFTREIAETKAARTEMLARQNEFPLRATIEPEDA